MAMDNSPESSGGAAYTGSTPVNPGGSGKPSGNADWGGGSKPGGSANAGGMTGKPGGGGGTGAPGWTSGQAGWQMDPQGILGDNTAGIAGSNPMLDMTAGLTANMGNNNQFLNAAGNAAQGSQTAGTGYLGAAGNTYGQAGSANAWEQNSADSYGSTGELAQRRISGDTIANDPATQAAIDRFQGSVAPMIQDAAGLSGLGDSSAVLNALSVGQSNMMLPLIQEAAAREERGLQGELSSAFGRGQGYGALGQNLGARGLAGAQGQFNIGEALGNRDARASQLFSSLQGQSHGQLMDQINQARTTGSMGRDMTQEGLDAQYNEFLRQSGLFEKSTFGPLDTISGMMGATAEGKK